MHHPDDMRTRAIRQKLLQRRHALLARYFGELERADEELESRESEEIERATEQWDATVLDRLGQADRRALTEIVEALQRIERGTYGVCDDCGERIAMARLEALPTATSCISCANVVRRAAGFVR